MPSPNARLKRADWIWAFFWGEYGEEDMKKTLHRYLGQLESGPHSKS